MADAQKRFGKYFLLDHLAQGGMAEIYRARLASAEGASRLIVIKKIQAGYGANKEFLQMFQSEIKVTMGFNHPNIVQLYDFGERDNQPFIAMELVDGRNVRQFMTRFAEMKQPFPIELAAYIVEQAAAGLHYAHTYRDKISGEPLNIVHRDISPQNILISFEGGVKVIDFGIAKASTNSESTRAGVIKGKPSYLSPEQISGEVLDGRSDVFALGAVLWELLTGKKLFSGESDLAVLKQIEACQTFVKPPSTLNPQVPKELDYICLRSLTKQREKRFQNAEEFQRALHKFIYSYSSEFNPTDLSYNAKNLFKNEILEDRKKIQKLNAIVEEKLSKESAEQTAENNDDIENNVRDTDEGSDEPPASSKKGKDKKPAEKSIPRGLVDIELGPKGDNNSKIVIEKTGTFTFPAAARTNASHTSISVNRPTLNAGTRTIQRPLQTQTSESNSKNKKYVMGIAVVLTLSIIGPKFGISVPFLSDFFDELSGSSEARLTLEGNDKNVIITLNGQTVANTLPTTLTGFPVGSPFKVTVTGPSGEFQKELTLKKGEAKTLLVTFSPPNTNTFPTETSNTNVKIGGGITLRLNLIPGGGQPSIQLNGKTLPPGSMTAPVSLDSPLELNVSRVGYKPFQSQFVVDAKQATGLKEWIMDVPLEPLHFGYLTIHTTPSANATLTIDGTPWMRKTPLENEKLPIGSYQIQLINEVLGMQKTIAVKIEEGKSSNIDEKLEIKN